MTTCMFGVVFILLGNLTGNAIQLGIFTMTAAGYDNPSKGSVLGIAVAALTFAVCIHVFSRRGGILMNNAFAIFKVSLVVAIIALGIAWKCGRDFGGGNTQNKNFEKPFSGSSGQLADYVESLLYILFTYSGFKQPFYVLSEAETPRRIFPIATTAAVVLQWLLFVLLNVVFAWAVDLSRLQATTLGGYTGPVDIAALFFESIFGEESPTPRRVMTGLLALSILGNIVVMTCQFSGALPALNSH
jgi:amino acid transporter